MKLESIKLEKFRVSECDVLQIKGGKVQSGSMDNSYEYSYTSIGNDGATKLDARLSDTCVDWE